jgi:hypothetical protein
LGAQFENLRVDPVNIRPVPGRRELKDIDPVCHEADTSIGIPIEAEGQIRLSTALYVGRKTNRLGEKEATRIQIDFTEPRPDLPRTGAARAERAEDLDLAESPRNVEFFGSQIPIWVGPKLLRARLPGQIPSGIYIVSAEVNGGATRGMEQFDERRGSIVVHAQIFCLNREGAMGRDQLGTIVQDAFDAFSPTNWVATDAAQVNDWVPRRFSPRMLASVFKVLPGCKTLSSLAAVASFGF